MDFRERLSLRQDSNTLPRWTSHLGIVCKGRALLKPHLSNIPQTNLSGIVVFLFKSSLNKKKNAIANFIAKATKLATHSYMKNSLIPNLTKR